MGDAQPWVREERRRTSTTPGRPQTLTAATHTGESSVHPRFFLYAVTRRPHLYLRWGGASKCLTARRTVFHDALLLCCQKKKVHLDYLLGALRQESSEDALKTSLDKTVCYLQDVKHRYCRTHANANAESLSIESFTQVSAQFIKPKMVVFVPPSLICL